MGLSINTDRASILQEELPEVNKAVNVQHKSEEEIPEQTTLNEKKSCNATYEMFSLGTKSGGVVYQQNNLDVKNNDSFEPDSLGEKSSEVSAKESPLLTETQNKPTEVESQAITSTEPIEEWPRQIINIQLTTIANILKNLEIANTFIQLNSNKALQENYLTEVNQKIEALTADEKSLLKFLTDVTTPSYTTLLSIIYPTLFSNIDLNKDLMKIIISNYLCTKIEELLKIHNEVDPQYIVDIRQSQNEAQVSMISYSFDAQINALNIDDIEKLYKLLSEPNENAETTQLLISELSEPGKKVYDDVTNSFKTTSAKYQEIVMILKDHLVNYALSRFATDIEQTISAISREKSSAASAEESPSQPEIKPTAEQTSVTQD